MIAPEQYAGKDEHGEYLVTVYPGEDGQPPRSEFAFRPDQWQTWSAPVKLEAVPAHQVVTA